jgi:hypothetical protein
VGVDVLEPSVPVEVASEPLCERSVMGGLFRIAVTEGGLGGRGNAGRGENAEKDESKA